jgi:transcriptional regulator with XRE-family HTH domain
MSEVLEINWYSNESATFGDRVAAAREAQGLTQKALAKRMGIALKTVDAWENDLSEPRANKLQMLAGVVNVSMAWLLTGDGPGLSSPDAEVAGPAQDVNELLIELRTLRSQVAHAADRMGVLEKRLKLALSEPAA